MADELELSAGLQLDPYQIVLRPLVTEKSTHFSERNNAYTFQVHPQATKPEIKQAIETLFEVRVDSVRTQNRVGKPRRHKFKVGYTRNWKKAIVKLHDDDRISFY